MKRINYFKFLEIFPEFIDMDDTDDVKLTFLSILKKKYWTRKEGDEPRLLPVKPVNDVKLLRDREFTSYCYYITFRGNFMFNLHIVDDTVFFSDLMGGKKYMTKEEITNFKRYCILENILNK